MKQAGIYPYPFKSILNSCTTHLGIHSICIQFIQKAGQSNRSTRRQAHDLDTAGSSPAPASMPCSLFEKGELLSILQSYRDPLKPPNPVLSKDEGWMADPRTQHQIESTTLELESCLRLIQSRQSVVGSQLPYKTKLATSLSHPSKQPTQECTEKLEHRLILIAFPQKSYDTGHTGEDQSNRGGINRVVFMSPLPTCFTFFQALKLPPPTNKQSLLSIFHNLLKVSSLH